MLQMKQVILAIDVGTTSMRGILYNNVGDILYVVQQETSPDFLENNRVEQDPLEWSKVLFKILEDSMAFSAGQNLKISGISLTAFRSPVFPVDKRGRPLYPAIMWQDKRTDKLVEQMKGVSDRVYDVTGLPVTSVFSGIKMRWLKENCPEVYNKAHKMVGVYEFLLFILTGKFITDHSLASRTNLFNLKKLEWDKEMLELFNVKREHLCELTQPGAVCGYLQQDVSKYTGIASGIPIICGGGDQQCAALGLGVIDNNQVAVNTGTGAYTIGLSDNPIFDVTRKVYCNVSAISGKYIVEKGMLTGGTVYRWMSEIFLSPDTPSNIKFLALNSGAENSPPGARGVLLIPRFKGIAGSSSNLKGCFLNLDLNTGMGDLARAVMEGIAFEQKDNITLIAELTRSVKEVYVSGGLTRSGLFNQIQADIYEKEVVALGNGEATSLGAWINGAIALGCYSSYKEIKNILGKKNFTKYSPCRSNIKLYRSIHSSKNKLVRALEAVAI